jgi:hypothetical protein
VLIEGLLHQGGTMLLSGPSKARKTYTYLDAGISLASGIPWLGHPTRKSVVAYLNLELPPHLVAQRVAAICEHRKIPPPADLHIWNLRGQKVDIDTIERLLPPLIEQTAAEATILDPHYKVSATSGMEENSNDDQGLLLSRMEALLGNAGSALLLAHHFAKGSAADKNAIDRASGGGVFARWPDVFMSLTPHEIDDAMTVEFALRAFPPMAPYVIRWAYPTWERDTELDPGHLKKAGPKAKYSASDALKKLVAGMTNAEWAKASGMKDATFRRKRDELVGDRVSEKDGHFYPNP